METFELTKNNFSKAIDIAQTILLYLIALLVPTFLGEFLNLVGISQSQLIVGSIVNCALVISAFNLKGLWKNAGVVCMPSIATILGGYVFKTASVYMVYMIPAIWLGNFAYVFIYKYFGLSKKTNYILTSILAIVVKVAIIFLAFNVLKALSVFPEKMVNTLSTAMSLTQLYTATIGSVIAFVILFVIDKTKKKN